jgi:hypothetical protein
MKVKISYTGLDDASMGNHVVMIMSWLIMMRAVLWIPKYTNINITVYLVSVWMIEMYPACVKYPVSASLFGSSSHVKEFVKLSRPSMSRLRKL